MTTHKDFALNLAKKAGEIIKKGFDSHTKIEWKKEDDTPLTITDQTVNDFVVNEIKKEFPNYGINIEEGGDKESNNEYVWTCDPIDGTMPFSHGYPTFLFSLALVKDGQPVLGVFYDAILDRMVFAEKGKGATCNGREIRVSDAKEISHHTILDSNGFPALSLLVKNKSGWTASLYSCQYGSMLVALGHFVGEVYLHHKALEGAPAKIIVEEAGGKVTDLKGNEQRYDKNINGFVASNGLIHDELIELVGKASDLKV